MEVFDRISFFVAVIVIVACIRCPGETFNASRGVDAPTPVTHVALSPVRAKSESLVRSRDKRIVVLDFRSDTEAANTEDLLALTEKAREHVFKISDYEVVTEESAKFILASYGTSVEQLVASSEVEIGATLGADYVLVGRLKKSGDYIVVMMRVHDTGDGRLLASDSYKAGDVLHAYDALQPNIVKLLKQMEGL